MKNIDFIDKYGTFRIKNPENYSGLYLPLAGEKGLKSSITPTLGGDSKTSQNTFLLEAAPCFKDIWVRGRHNIICHT